MKKTLVKGMIALGIALIIPGYVTAQMMGQYNGGGMMGGYYNNYRVNQLEKSDTIQKILAKIRKEQGLKEDQTVNPDKVNSKLLGELGDAVMDIMIGNNAAHERMDEIMGGEGSANLETMHEQMGYRYLQGLPIGMMGGQGYGRFSGGRNYYGGMMGFGNQTGYLGGFYGQNPYMPMMSFGSFMGMGTLMDFNWMLDYRFADYLGLSKEQAQKITELKSDYEKKADPVRSQLLVKRHKIFDLWSARKPDRSAIKKTDREVLELLSSISDQETEYRVKVLDILTPDQRKKIDYNGMMYYQNRYLNQNDNDKEGGK